MINDAFAINVLARREAILAIKEQLRARAIRLHSVPFRELQR